MTTPSNQKESSTTVKIAKAIMGSLLIAFAFFKAFTWLHLFFQVFLGYGMHYERGDIESTKLFLYSLAYCAGFILAPLSIFSLFAVPGLILLSKSCTQFFKYYKVWFITLIVLGIVCLIFEHNSDIFTMLKIFNS